MPDVHLGKGATVGQRDRRPSGAIIPAAVGRGHRLRHDGGAHHPARRATCPTTCARVRTAIEAAVPHGRTDNGGPQRPRRVAGRARRRTPRRGRALQPGYDAHHRQAPAARPRRRTSGTSARSGRATTSSRSASTRREHVWVMLHCGSRGVGNRIGSYFIELAKEDMRRWFINLPDAGPRVPARGDRALRRLRRGGAAGRRTTRAPTAS